MAILVPKSQNYRLENYKKNIAPNISDTPFPELEIIIAST